MKINGQNISDKRPMEKILINILKTIDHIMTINKENKV